MTQAALRTLVLAAATAMTITPALAQASRDVTAAQGAPVVTSQQKVVPLQIGVPGPSSPVTTGGDDSSLQRPGAMQGFGPMQTNLFPSAPPLPGVVKK